ncbi:MAG: hypothetical protein JW910_03300 [Anaerolineae bacterium]|nr:hypothetical protein [Anaerolineae bacterium]
MSDLLFRKYDEMVRERNLYRCELELYRKAFDAMVQVAGPDDAELRPRWDVQRSQEAERAVRDVLRYRSLREG